MRNRNHDTGTADTRRWAPAGGIALAAVLLAVLLAPLAGVGCRARGPQVLVLLTDRDVEGLDPHASGGIFQTQNLLANVYQGLVTLDPDMRLTPALAVSWSNPDDNTWEFVLREDVRFHTGQHMTAEDVVFSLLRARDHPTSAVRGVLANLEDVRIRAPYQVRLRTHEPDASLLSRLRDVYVVSREAMAPYQASVLTEGSCGTGPYRVVKRTPGTGVELQAFASYWGSRPSIQSARLVARSYDGTSPAGPESEPILFFTQPGTELYRRALGAAVLHTRSGISINYLAFDLRSGHTPGVRLFGAASGNPFQDPRVRQAMALAIDYQRLRREGFAGLGIIPSQLVPPEVVGFDPTLAPPVHDLEEARRLLAETPYKDGFEVDLDVREMLGRYGPTLADDLAAIGIRVKLRDWPEAAFFERVSQGLSSLYLLRFSCRSGDAQEFFDKWVHSRDTPRGYGTFNFSYQSNPLPNLDQEIEEARRTLAPRRRLERLQRIMRRVMEAHLALPLFAENNLLFLSPGLTWTPRADTFRLVAEVHPEP